MQITIYSTTSCPYCRMLKEYLKGKSITYEEKLVDQDNTAKDEMEKISGGFLGVPFTVITKDDASRELIVGFDIGKLDNILR
jgi:glutaredoxin